MDGDENHNSRAKASDGQDNQDDDNKRRSKKTTRKISICGYELRSISVCVLTTQQSTHARTKKQGIGFRFSGPTPLHLQTFFLCFEVWGRTRSPQSETRAGIWQGYQRGKLDSFDDPDPAKDTNRTSSLTCRNVGWLKGQNMEGKNLNAEEDVAQHAIHLDSQQ